MELIIRVCIPSAAGAAIYTPEGKIEFDANGVAELPAGWTQYLRGYPDLTVYDGQSPSSPAPETEIESESGPEFSEPPNENTAVHTDFEKLRVFVDGDQVCAMRGDDGPAVFVDRAEGVTGDVTEAEREAVLAKWHATHAEADVGSHKPRTRKQRAKAKRASA